MSATKSIHIERTVNTPTTIRTRQLSAMFDCPLAEAQRLEWDFELPDLRSEESWRIGLIVGPSGSGKTTLARELFPNELDVPLNWSTKSVIDDFKEGLSVKDISDVCMAVGFNTIPAWMRPYEILSNGEKFRVELARRLIESDGLVVVDEFSSVVDRQVAKIASHAVQKTCRRAGIRFVAVTCHYDVLDWLQPDWVIDVPNRSFSRRLLQQRPSIEVEIRAVPYETWRIFAPFHYLTSSLHRAARCYALFVDGQVAAFAGMQHRPHPKVDDIMGCSRLVTLPDYQGLGLAFVLIDTVSAAYKALGKRVHTYPAHPAFIRSFDRSDKWKLKVRPGGAPIMGQSSGLRKKLKPKQSEESGLRHRQANKWIQGSRPNAVFEYVGPALTKDKAKTITDYWHG